MANRRKSQEGKGPVIPLVVIVIVLAAGYVALDRYSAGQKDMLTVETRGLQMISALTKYRQETGSYPDSLDKLVPKHAPAVSKCPNGSAIDYRLAGGEYALSCDNVVFKQKPYRYESRSKSWNG
ncbi:MAG: hypothetical protein WA373_05620 [Burkholderiales bacterium]